MSFEKLDRNNTEVKDERSFIIICNLKGKDLQGVKNFASIFGLKDQVVLSDKNGESVIKDIIADKITTSEVEGQKERVIIFNNVSPAKINMFIDNLKKIKIHGVLMASVTDMSREWTINTLISNLVEERRLMSAGRELKH
ncbi:DUF3783 domain-containing protein [Clostridium sp.]|uniref:DUF3783 domain-containing protein n=1 Tax=Clostridium sp. TaxID=1506 RepID=UPI003F2BB854